MKKFFCVMMLMLLLSQPVIAVELIQIPYRSDVKIYLDKDSIEERPGYVLATIRLVPGEQSIDSLKRAIHSDVAYVLQLSAFRLDTREYNIIEFAYFDEEDNLLAKEEFPYSEDDYELLPETGYIGPVYDALMRLEQ